MRHYDINLFAFCKRISNFDPRSFANHYWSALWYTFRSYFVVVFSSISFFWLLRQGFGVHHNKAVKMVIRLSLSLFLRPKKTKRHTVHIVAIFTILPFFFLLSAGVETQERIRHCVSFQTVFFFYFFSFYHQEKVRRKEENENSKRLWRYKHTGAVWVV